MKDVLSSKIYYVIKEAMPQVNLASSEEKRVVVEQLIELGEAVKQPEIGGRGGKSFFGKKEMFEFFTMRKLSSKI